MRGLKLGAMALAILLVVSVIPFGLAEASDSKTSQTFDNTTREEEIARGLIEQLQRLSEFSERAIEPLKDKLPANSTIIQNYNLAEEFKEKALSEYEEGDYYNAILDSLTAMHHYKLALKGLKEGKERMEEVRSRIKAEVERLQRYFGLVEKTIKAAENQGIDVSTLQALYEETKAAYEKVLEDLKEGDVEKAREDLEIAKEKKTVLDEELKRIREQLAHANADKIVSQFLEKGGRAIEIVQNLTQMGEERGYNVTELQERLDAFVALYTQVEELASEEKWDEALDLIEENREVIEEFYQAIKFIQRKAMEKKLEEELQNFREFVKNFTERMREDARKLRELKLQGVDTRAPELQLRVASQEFKLGINLMKAKKPAEAKAHFAIALEALQKVEEFIQEHT